MTQTAADKDKAELLAARWFLLVASVVVGTIVGVTVTGLTNSAIAGLLTGVLVSLAYPWIAAQRCNDGCDAKPSSRQNAAGPSPFPRERVAAGAPTQKSILTRPYQKAPLNPNGEYWLYRLPTPPRAPGFSSG